MSSPISLSAGRSADRAAGDISVPEVVVAFVAYVLCFVARAVHIDQAFGLPAHPLIVHVPVVVIPALSLASLALAARGDWRERFGLAWGVLALVALGGTVLAAGAGHELLAGFGGAPEGDLATHVDLADVLEWVMFGFVAVVLVGVVLRHRLAARGPLALLLGAATVVLAVAAAYYVVRVGDAGARAVWARG